MNDAFVDRVKRDIGSRAEVILDATLTIVTPGTRTEGQLTAGTNPTDADHACKGYIGNYSAYHIANSLVERSDRKITLLAGTLPAGVVPTPGDKITIEGVEYEIAKERDAVKRDTAGATWTCQGRA